MNVDAAFTTLVFNRDDAAGFTVNGSSFLTVMASSGGAAANLTVSDTDGNGVSTISAPLRVNTDAGGTRLLTIDNRETGTIGASLVISGGISATTPANGYGFRFGGAGSTRITGTIANVGASLNIQQANIGGQPMAGTVTIAGNQSLGSASVSFAGGTNGVPASTAKFVMGDSTSDIQSWGATAVQHASTIEIKSTATTTGVSLSSGASQASSGGTLDVSGSLSATSLAIGGSAYTGILKVSGSATFSGALTSGATEGSKIIGGGASNGTLTLASGTVSSAVTIGGSGTHENNLALVKNTAGTLTLSGTNTYTGTTTISAGKIAMTNALALQNSAYNTTGSNGSTIGLDVTTGLSSGTLTLGGLAGSVNLASAITAGYTGSVTNLTLNPQAGISNTYSGVISNGAAAMTLTKSGAGTQVLSGANDYTGATNVTAGTLVIGASGSLGNTTTTIGIGGTLAGGGTIGGATTIEGTHNPGFSPGTQTFTNGLSYAATATLNWELTGNTTDGRGTSYDAVNVTGGSFALATGASIDLTFGGTVNFLNEFWGLNQEWLVVDLSGGATAADSNLFTIGSISGGGWDPGLGTFGILRKDGSSTADAVYLTWTAVPEPSVVLLGGLGLLALLRRRRCA